MLCNLSGLNSEKIKAIEVLEKEIGKTFLAYTCFDATFPEISENERKKITDIEKKLGIVLVAVE